MKTSERTQILLVSVFVIICSVSAIYLWNLPDNEQDVVIDPTNKKSVVLGKTVYAKHCASCHGAKLEGQPNWKQRLPNGRLPAPPHDATGHTWHHPDKLLFKMTKYGPASLLPEGQYQSDMPGLKGVLSDDEILASLAYIKSTWPKEIQNRHDQINARVPR
ncbi:MAG: cytochrome c [Rhodospirillaceae bacterium]|jgi:mono/diheme cytochrome c family protein